MYIFFSFYFNLCMIYYLLLFLFLFYDLLLVRLVEEVKQKCGGVQLQNEDVYMATSFQEFIQMFVRRLRGEDQEEELVIDYVSVKHTNSPLLTLS